MNAINGYEASADQLLANWAQLDPMEVLAPVVDFLPGAGARALDVGAGDGRDARFMAKRGCDVLAVEPVAAFRDVSPMLGVTWLDDRLPDLRQTPEGPFDFALLNGVLHHLRPDQQVQALQVVAARAARVALSLRIGPTPADRPAFKIDEPSLLEAVAHRVVHRVERGSIQDWNKSSGVTWVWLVLDDPI